MIIVWGTMSAGIRRGWVGDYCPVCRTCTGFRGKQMRAIPHLMFVPLWIGKPLAWHCRCAECRTRIARPGRFYLRSVRHRLEPAELVQQTNPDSTDGIASVLEREMRVDQGTAPFEERIDSAVDALALLSLEIALRSDRGRTRSMSSLIAVGFIIAATVAFGLAAAQSPWVWPAGAVATSMLILLVYHVIWAARRSKERFIGELLARVCPRDAHDEDFVARVLELQARSGSDWAVGLKAPVVSAAAGEWLDRAGSSFSAQRPLAA